MRMQVFLSLILTAFSVSPAAAIDLLERYPTRLTAGDASPERARPWKFTESDIFQLSQFHLEISNQLRVVTGPADLGIGHSADGAVWAVVLPHGVGTLSSSAANGEEAVAHVWLRFHPLEIHRLFPPDSVSPGGASNLVYLLRAIADQKMTSSWQSGGNAMIPERKDLTVDVDTKSGLRRFFVVDRDAQTAEYVAAFERRAVKAPDATDAGKAQQAFDQIWSAFDRDYAMFALRPEVDWAKLSDEYRPKALRSKSTSELAGVCAEMLAHLRDLHVWVTVSGQHVPVFNRPRVSNSNPSAHAALLGKLRQTGRVRWTVTEDDIGYVSIDGWSDDRTPAQCDEVLEQMRNTRGLIVDVRLNGGGSEPLAGNFAGRFLEKEFVYAFSQYRSGPAHTNLTDKIPRAIAPRGPWRYNRPVILLIGQKCMSSNESFVGMMTGDPELTTMGDHTCGSSGNPEMIHLPGDMTVSVPRWIDYLPDGTPLDERGFEPQVVFKPTEGAFAGDRDDLLSAALARLRRLPLPKLPIAGPAVVPEPDSLTNQGVQRP